MSEQEKSAYAVGYAAQWYAAVVVAVLVACIGGIQALGPTELGIPAVAFRWLGIVVIGLSVLQAVLPKVQAVPIKNYDEVKRVEALTAEPPEGMTYPPEFVDAVAEALLRKRAEDLERRFPVATLRQAAPVSSTLEEYESRLRPEERERRAGLARWQREALIEHAAEDSKRATTEIRSHND